MRGITPSMLGKKVRCPDCDKTTRLSTDPYAAGRVIGDFITQRRLGVGSIGSVHFAHQISLDRPVALKVLSEEYSNSKGIEAFLKEARAAALLSHPNLVQSFGVGAEDGVCFMAMSFIEGETVKDKIKREGKIQVDEALHVAQQVAEGLFYAWSEAGLIHRDIKPENIMLTKDGTVKLTDLGLAISEQEWHPDMEISGSPSYMSPEQFTGEKIDTRSDVYSMGVSLYQMISGKLPFLGATLKTVARQHFYEAAKPLHKLDPMVPAKIDALVQKMMAKDPTDRFQNMEELLHAIWEVRQNTAPDKELVPSVHTISIKRLDYGLQEISKERKKIFAAGQKEEKKKKDVLMRSLAIGIPVLVVAVVIAIAASAYRSKKEKYEKALVDKVAAVMANEPLDISTARLRWEEASSKLPAPSSDFERELHTRMELYKALLNNQDMVYELETIRSTESEAKQKLQDLIERNRRMEEELRRGKDKVMRREKELLDKLAELSKKAKETQNGTAKKTNNETGDATGNDTPNNDCLELTKEHEREWKDAVRLKGFLFAVSKQKYPEARAYIEVMSIKHPKDTVWFDTMTKMVDDLEKLEKALTVSGSKYAGTKIEEGVVKSILDGEIAYIESNSGKIQRSEWTELEPESVEAIAMEVFPDDSNEHAKALANILKGDAVRAAVAAPNDKEITAIRDTLCEYRLDRIRIQKILDPKRAKEDAIAFLKQLSSSPDTQEKYKAILKRLFSGE